MKRTYLFAFTFIIAVSTLEIVNIFFSNKVAVDSVKATNIKNELRILDEKNSALKTQILSLSSYEAISSRASELGFISPKKFITLESPIRIAFNNDN